MDGMLDLFIGDPVYDEQKNVIRRDFGVKNIVAIMVVGFIGYSLMGEMKPISGKRKMKGGAGSFADSELDWVKQFTPSGDRGWIASVIYWGFFVGMFVCPAMYLLASNHAGIDGKFLGKYKEEWEKCAIYTWSAVGIYVAFLLFIWVVGMVVLYRLNQN